MTSPLRTEEMHSFAMFPSYPYALPTQGIHTHIDTHATQHPSKTYIKLTPTQTGLSY